MLINLSIFQWFQTQTWVHKLQSLLVARRSSFQQNTMHKLKRLYRISSRYKTPSRILFAFPVPTTTAYAALDSSQTYPDYQTINLVFPPDSAALLQLCSNCFKYTNDICNKFAAGNKGRSVLFVVHNLMMPKSRGKITLASADPTIEPNVYTGTYTDDDDLALMADSLKDFARVLNTKYFRSVNANLVDIGLCADNDWECYALAMSATMWHYAGTCVMGSVVDTELKVKGVKNLRIVDASVMPTEVSGNINAAITMIAERAASLMLAKENRKIKTHKPKRNHGLLDLDVKIGKKGLHLFV